MKLGAEQQRRHTELLEILEHGGALDEDQRVYLVGLVKRQMRGPGRPRRTVTGSDGEWADILNKEIACLIKAGKTRLGAKLEIAHRMDRSVSTVERWMRRKKSM